MIIAEERRSRNRLLPPLASTGLLRKFLPRTTPCNSGVRTCGALTQKVMKRKFALLHPQELLTAPSSGSETWGNCVLHDLYLPHPAMPANVTLSNCRHHLEIDTIRMQTENKRDVCYITILRNPQDIPLTVQLQET